MNSARQRTQSLWMPELAAPAPELAADERADVAVIGAGIAGVTTAYLLARGGRSVILLDAGAPGGGMTARTTAHLASALDDRWADLVALRGNEEARQAAEAHRAAIDFIDRVQSDEGIACDFARLDGFLFLGPGDDPEILATEIEAAHSVGLTDVAWADRAPLPDVDTGKCLRFPRQGRFHPLKYLAGLIRCIEGDGGRLFTGRAVFIEDGQPVRIETEGGRRIEASAAVVATNAPINDTVAIHTKQAPYRTYVIAGRVPKGSVPDALYWDTLDPYHYVRLQPHDDADDILIVGGEDHKSGQERDMEARFAQLAAWTRKRFPQVRSFEHRWSGQVMEPVDYLGFLGRNPGDTHVYIATGDSGMGMTHTTIGGLIVSDLIAGRHNPWAALFDPARKTAGAVGDFMRENLNVAAQFIDYVTSGDAASVGDIPAGSGAIVRRGAHKIAAWRDDSGQLHEHSAVCTHLGCIVAWNPLEGCWDCPCHGSQFAADGTPINGPAVKPLGKAASRREPRRTVAG